MSQSPVENLTNIENQVRAAGGDQLTLEWISITATILDGVVLTGTVAAGFVESFNTPATQSALVRYANITGGIGLPSAIIADQIAINRAFASGDLEAANEAAGRFFSGMYTAAIVAGATALFFPGASIIGVAAFGYFVGQQIWNNRDGIKDVGSVIGDIFSDLKQGLQNVFDNLEAFLLEYYSIEEFFASALGPVGTLGLLFGRLLGFIDPLVIDLDGDGVNTTNVTVSGVTFDLDNNGTEEGVGWFEAEDGILVQDWKGAVDENGNIIGDGEAQDRSELFATFGELSRHDLNGDGILDASDVDPQATQDTNGDGMIDADDVILPDDLEDVNGDGVIDINDVDERAQDLNGDGIITEDEIEQSTVTTDLDVDGVLDTVNVGYDEVNIWIDANQNGNVDDGELQTLAEAGITSIDLNETPLDVEDNGNIINSESTVTFADGGTAVINGIDLFRDTINQSYEQQINNLDLSPERLADRLDVFTLPQIQGSGNVPHLLIAALANDDILNAWRAVGEYRGGSFAEFEDLVEDLILEWSGVNELRNESRGNISAPILNAIEEFLGTEYVAPNAPEGTTVSNVILPEDAQRIGETWDSFVSSIALRFYIQNRSVLNANNENFAGDLTYDFTTDNFVGDWTNTLRDLKTRYTNPDISAEEREAIADTLAQIYSVTSAPGNSRDGVAAVEAIRILQSITIVNPVGDFADDFESPIPESVTDEQGQEPSFISLGVLNAHAGTFVSVTVLPGGGIFVSVNLPEGLVVGDLVESRSEILSNSTRVDSLLYGRFDEDTYRIDLTSNAEDNPLQHIVINDSTFDANRGTLDLVNNIEDLIFIRDGNNLVVQNTETGSSVMVRGQFFTDFTGVENLIYTGELRAESTLIDDLNTEANQTGGSLSREDIERLAWNRGTDADDLIQKRGSGTQTFFGGLGNDIIRGGNGEDTYIYRRGDGNDVIAAHVNDDDILYMDGIRSSEVEYSRSGFDLIITVTTTGQTITVIGQFNPSFSFGVASIVFFNEVLVDGLLVEAEAIINRAAIPDLAPFLGDDQIDLLIGSGLDETFIAQEGDDLLSGQLGSDTYVYNSGDGNDTIYEVISRGALGGFDILELADLTSDQVRFERTPTDLFIVDLLTGQRILVEGQFFLEERGNGLERVVFADGETLDRDQVRDASFFTGTQSGETLTGTDTTLNTERFDGNEGDDILIGGQGSDEYYYSSGDGNDTINEGIGETDRLIFRDLNRDQVTFTRMPNDDLIITDLTTGQQIFVLNHFIQSALKFGLEEIVFANGEILDKQSTQNFALIAGTDEADDISGRSNETITERFQGNGGDDILRGGNGNDIYIYASGDGNDLIIDNGNTDAVDELRLVDLNSDEVELRRSGDDLTVFDLNTGNEVVIRSHFSNFAGIERIAFANGEIFNQSDIVENFVFFGNDQVDDISGESDQTLAERFQGNRGDDILRGGNGSDIYIYASGDGNDLIIENGNADAADELRLVDLNSDEIELRRDDNDLIVVDLNTGSEITIRSHFLNDFTTRNGVESITFANGDTLDRIGIRERSEYLGSNTIIAGSGADTVDGDASSNTLFGAEGNDTLLARGGNDILVGDIGNDTVDGGTSDDTYIYNRGDGNDVYIDSSFFSGGLNDTVELFRIAPSAVTVTREGNDFILTIAESAPGEGDGGSIRLTDSADNSGHVGLERVVFEDGTVWTRDELRGLILAADSTDGDDIITGYNANTTINSGAGDDTILARAGNDIVIGGTGNDTVDGGTSDDTYIYNRGDGNDVYIDSSFFSGGLNDTVELFRIAPSAVTVTREGNDFILTIAESAPGEGDGGSIRLTDSADNSGHVGLERVVFEDGTVWTRDELREESLIDRNDAPIIGIPLADQSSGEDDIVRFTLPSDAFSDTDGDVLTLTATLVDGTELPSWLTFDEVAGTFSGTPPQDFNGSLDILVTASDGEFEVSDMFTLEITATNDSPIVSTPLADQSSSEDEAVSFVLPANAFSDVDGDALTLTATLVGGAGLPLWLTFDAVAGTFTGSPPQDFNGSLDIVVTASDGEFVVSDTFSLDITAVNDAPIVATPLSDQSSPEDEAVSFALPIDAFRDADGDVLALSATLVDGTALPSWLTFDGTAGTFSGTPPQDFNGVLDILVTASDGVFEVSDTFSLDIAAANDAPVVSTPLVDQSSAEDHAVSFALPADAFSDVDGDALTLIATFVGGTALPAWLTFDADAGTFSGMPPKDFNGMIDIMVTASDGEFDVSDTFTLEIAAVNDAPIVATPLADQSSPEDEAVSFTLPADVFSDVDGDALTLTAALADGSELPTWLSFDGSTFSGMPPQDFNGILEVTVTASDGEFEVSDTFILETTAVNDAPIVSTPLTDQSSTEDEAVSFVLPDNTFSDVDGDTLTLTATLAGGASLPLWLTFDAVAGTFTGTPPQDFNGVFDIVVTASDGEFEASDAFSLDINAVNDAPILVTSLADQSVEEDSVVSFALPADTFNDIDGDVLTLAATLADGSELPDWLTFDGSAFIGTPPQDFNGSLNVVVTASDDEFETFSSFTLDVTAVNDAPILVTPLIDQSSPEDEVVSFIIPDDAFNDVDGDELILSATLIGGAALPLWLTFDAAAGIFSGTPPQDFNGILDIVITASDSEFEVSDTFMLNVSSVNDAPIVSTPLIDQSILEDEAVSFVLPADAFVDIDGDSLILTASLADGSDLPSWLVFDTDARMFTGTPPQDFNTDTLVAIEVRVTASDGQESVSDTFSLDIVGVNDGPVAQDDSGFEANQGSSIVIGENDLLANDTDVDGDTLSISDVTSSGSGSVDLNDDGNIVYAPETGFVGEDTFTYTITDGEETSTATVTVNVTENDTIPDDAIVGSDGNDFIGGSSGDDDIFGKGGNDFIFGGRGRDNINGGAGNDFAFGGRGHDTLNGGSGSDILLGGNGQDILNGDEGNDLLLGGRGVDTITGGAGNDFLLGGRGRDTFVFNTGDGRDVIGDFGTGNNRGGFISGGDRISFDELMGFATQERNHVSFDFGNGDAIILANTRLAALDRDAFTFF